MVSLEELRDLEDKAERIAREIKGVHDSAKALIEATWGGHEGLRRRYLRHLGAARIEARSPMNSLNRLYEAST